MSSESAMRVGTLEGRSTSDAAADGQGRVPIDVDFPVARGAAAGEQHRAHAFQRLPARGCRIKDQIARAGMNMVPSSLRSRPFASRAASGASMGPQSDNRG